jgi:hypothetical protein
MSKIIPLFKIGNPQNPENYRPIANMNHLGKIYEKLILERVWSLKERLLGRSLQNCKYMNNLSDKLAVRC